MSSLLQGTLVHVQGLHKKITAAQYLTSLLMLQLTNEKTIIVTALDGAPTMPVGTDNDEDEDEEDRASQKAASEAADEVWLSLDSTCVSWLRVHYNGKKHTTWLQAATESWRMVFIHQGDSLST
jgi:hypothetical protein